MISHFETSDIETPTKKARNNEETAINITFNYKYQNKHVQRTCLVCHAACEVEFQPFNRSYSQPTFFNFL